jgi:serine protease
VTTEEAAVNPFRIAHPQRRLHLLLVAAIATTLVATGVVVAIALRGAAAGAGLAAHTTPMAFHLEPGLTPDVADVPGLRDGDPPRPVARLQDPDGMVMDIVLDEIVVTYRDEVDLARFVESIGGQVVDRFDDEGEPVRDALVSFPRFQVDDPAAVAAAMEAHEPDLGGDWTVGDPAVLAVLGLLTRAAEAGVSVMPNVLHEHTGFFDGTTTDGEAPDPYGPDAFTWPYVASSTFQDVGLDVAWRLLADLGAFDDKPVTAGMEDRIRIMVIDQGFRLNDDMPRWHTIERAEWGEAGWGGESWHGATVVNALAGRVNNGFGGAGPAGPLDLALIAVGDARPGSWDNVRGIRDLVAYYQPHIINMSYRATVTTHREEFLDFYERQFGTMRDIYGALPFGSAGNESRNVDARRDGAKLETVMHLPCEAAPVVCVGGMGENTTARAVTGPDAGSNYGTETGPRSVEIWGPYFVVAQSGASGNPARARGTSLATPFVAGVAALIKATDPRLGPDEIWQIMAETAHNGGIGSEATGHQRRINARDAVLLAYGKPVDRPQISIGEPRAGQTFLVGDFVELKASTRDHLGRTNVSVTWTSNRDGTIAGPATTDQFTESLSIGRHRIVATATDRLGQTWFDEVTIEVLERPIVVVIDAPSAGQEVQNTTSGLTLIGTAYDQTRPLEKISDHFLRWELVRVGASQPLMTGSGRSLWVPQGTLDPGDYRAKLTVSVGTQTKADEVRFTVVEPDPDAPSVTILQPSRNSAHETTVDGLSLSLWGRAWDSAGQELPGTQLRWVARRGGEEQVLCAGSHTPGAAPGGGGFAALISCTRVDATLDIPIGHSAWVIVLEAYASPTLVGSSDTNITATLTPVVP